VKTSSQHMALVQLAGWTANSFCYISHLVPTGGKDDHEVDPTQMANRRQHGRHRHLFPHGAVSLRV
jgi:hypothetical protein